MKMPGFTAEASLCKTGDGNYMNTVHANIIDGKEILPQLCYSPRPGLFCCWLPYTGWYCRRIYSVKDNEFAQLTTDTD